ncbi:hypothetical protein AHAS_Ahas18G0118700 [Arachis hypogaea]
MIPTSGALRSCVQQADKFLKTTSHGVEKDKQHLVVPKILRVKEHQLPLITPSQMLPSLDMMVSNGLLFPLNFTNSMSHLY